MIWQLAAWTVCLSAAPLVPLPLPVEISIPSVPPGATAQIRLTFTSPRQIASGSFLIDLDPAIFGPPSAVDVYSANGDQVGSAWFTDNHVSVTFASASGGVGRLPGLPALVVTVPVLATVPVGATGSVRIAPGLVPWRDVLGYHFLPAAVTGAFKAGGALSIDSVTPGGGLLPAGAKVRLTGRGFLTITEVSVDGVALHSVTYLDPRAMELTLAAPADLTGLRVRARNSNSAAAEFYPALARGKYSPPSSSRGLPQPIFSQQTVIAAMIGPGDGPGIALQNPTLETMDITQRWYQGTTPQMGTFSLGPGETYFVEVRRQTSTTVQSQVPFRAMIPPATATGSDRSRFDVSWYQPAKPVCAPPPRGAPTITDLPCWLAVAGAGPVTTPVTVQWRRPVPFSVSLTTEGGNWLTARTDPAVACNTPPCKPQISLIADPDNLGPGDYNATVTVTADDPSLLPESFPFRFRVATSILSSDAPPYVWFDINESIYSRGPALVRITGIAPGTPFTAKVWDWEGGPKPSEYITVTPAEGITPATLGIYVNPLQYQPAGLGFIDVFGPANTVTIPVNMVYRGAEARPIPPMASAMTFWATSSVISKPQSLFVSAVIEKVETVTQNGTQWLSARVEVYGNQAGLVVKAEPSGLAPGAYTGTVNFVFSVRGQTAMGHIDVTLVVAENAEGLTIEPAELRLSTPSGSDTKTKITASSVYGPVTMEAEALTETGDGWLTVYDSHLLQIRSTLGTAEVSVDARNLPPGTYRGTIRVTAPEGSKTIRTIPMTLQVTPALPAIAPAGPPLPVSVVNAASLTPGAIAPGEILTIFGMNLGERVLFDNAPATVLYTSSTQVNVVVPDAVAGRASVAVSAEANGMRGSVGAPVTTVAPGLFTADGSGRGQARTGTPAVRGGRVHLFATGIGLATSPSAVTLEIGGIATNVQLAQLSSALVELTATVPTAVSPGPAVPVILTVNSVRSPDGVTLAVQ